MLDGFCEYLRRQGKSENTVKAYCQGMKEYMRWHEETFGKRMKMFLRANVLDYISYLRTVKGLSNRSVNAKLASLHSFNLYLIAAGYTKEVVLDKQDYLKVQLAYASPSTVSREEVERFRQEILEHCGVRDYAIVTILAYAGLRISECLALRVEDISLPARVIREDVKHLYTQEEIDKILNRFIDNDTFTCVFLTSCYTGMRTGEVCALTWDDVDLDKGIIKISHNVYDKPKDEKGRWFLGSTKTKTGTRICRSAQNPGLLRNDRNYGLA